MPKSREFDGPLDLLLEEVRRQKVAIEDVSMAPIVARFLEYVRTAAEHNIGLDMEWLHMAATLIHWKSRSLLPSDIREFDQADPIRDELVQQLLARRKEAAGELARRQALEEARFSHAADPTKAHESKGVAFVTAWDLIQQARELARWVEQHREDRREWGAAFRIEPDDVTVGEMMEYLRTRTPAEPRALDAVTLLHDQPTASHRSCLFLGMLELARDQQIRIEQDEDFGPIWLSLPT